MAGVVAFRLDSYSARFELDLREKFLECFRIKNTIEMANGSNDSPRRIFGETTPVLGRTARSQQRL